MSTRRFFVSRLAMVCVLACGVANVQAQSYPTKSLRIVVPFGAGGVADLTARTVAQQMSESLGQSVVIDNRPGAGGIVAADLVAKSDADGHTLLLMSNANAVSAGLFKTLPFDPVKDFTPVSLMGTFDLAIVTSAGFCRTAQRARPVFHARRGRRLSAEGLGAHPRRRVTAEAFPVSAPGLGRR